ncbi:hypothetical protein CUJ89_17475 [Burkholderia pyrrocinia]|uniref:Uncharacterized protein n=1 Tax=Burkholderia pyrrocinia TaxID=60550 RepID=A0A2Z5MXX7_BURPY|nr:hypothetical protein CUJ89_17475 [Burkholderia pyrrocinia]
MRVRCRAVVGAGGIDAASLGFGRQTKHPARRQAPWSHVQHCAGDGVVHSGEPFATGFLSSATVARHLPATLRRRGAVSGRRVSGLSPLYKRRAPPNLF